jgi:hypothetical protein
MFSLRYSVAQSAEMCLPNLVGFCREKRSDDFFHSVDVHEVKVRPYMEGWEANCIDKQVEFRQHRRR